ncbi:MAG: hypothetical protein PHF00_01985 [Elusimicrobia bacterium]|nr:hypothetical protein [Elusimicrobiota bacterium]
MLILIGILLVVSVAWLAASLTCIVLPRLRRWATYVFLPPAGASLGIWLAKALTNRWTVMPGSDHPRDAVLEVMSLSVLLTGFFIGFTGGALLAPRLNARFGLRVLGIYDDPQRRAWWESRRLMLNVIMAVAGITAFIVSAAIETTHPWLIHAAVWCAGAYLAWMAFANTCYCLGPALEAVAPPGRLAAYRHWSYWTGFGICCAVPAGILVLWAT